MLRDRGNKSFGLWVYTSSIAEKFLSTEKSEKAIPHLKKKKNK